MYKRCSPGHILRIFRRHGLNVDDTILPTEPSPTLKVCAFDGDLPVATAFGNTYADALNALYQQLIRAGVLEFTPEPPPTEALLPLHHPCRTRCRTRWKSGRVQLIQQPHLCICTMPMRIVTISANDFTTPFLAQQIYIVLQDVLSQGSILGGILSAKQATGEHGDEWLNFFTSLRELAHFLPVVVLLPPEDYRAHRDLRKLVLALSSVGIRVVHATSWAQAYHMFLRNCA